MIKILENISLVFIGIFIGAGIIGALWKKDYQEKKTLWWKR